jgi:hypothetical protein
MLCKIRVRNFMPTGGEEITGIDVSVTDDRFAYAFS